MKQFNCRANLILDVSKILWVCPGTCSGKNGGRFADLYIFERGPYRVRKTRSIDTGDENAMTMA